MHSYILQRYDRAVPCALSVCPCVCTPPDCVTVPACSELRNTLLALGIKPTPAVMMKYQFASAGGTIDVAGVRVPPLPLPPLCRLPSLRVVCGCVRMHVCLCVCVCAGVR